jgi:methyl-accepting chemotaxis protein
MGENKSLNAELQEVSKTLNQVTEGDLTVRLSTDYDNSELERVARSFNEMLRELEGTLVEMQSFGAEVATATGGVTTETDELRKAGEQVSHSIEDITAGVTQQTDKLDSVSGELTDLSATIEEIASSSDEVATLSQEAAEAATNGREISQQSIETMEEIEGQADATVDKIEALEDAVAEIGGIIDLIEDIADQTNVLALNASIEAARAGQEGDGFAVVANEVKTLATETQEATQDVATIVTEVETTTDEAVSDIHTMRDAVAEGTDSIDETLSALNTIEQKVSEANTGIQSISDATDDQADSAQEVASMVEEVTSLSQQNQDRAETVSDAITDQVDSLQQISDTTDELDDLVAELSRCVDTFHVSDVDAEDHSVLTNEEYEAAVSYIEQHNEELLTRSNDVVVAFTDVEDGDYTDEVNIAGRQRMLSQRIAKTVLMLSRNERAGEVSQHVKSLKSDLQDYVSEYNHALETLDSGGRHDGTQLQRGPPAVTDEIERVREIWEPFKQRAEIIITESRFETTLTTGTTTPGSSDPVSGQSDD